MKSKKIYALYKGDKLLADGTILQIARKMNVKYESIYFMLSDAYKRRCNGSNRRRVLVCLDD